FDLLEGLYKINKLELAGKKYSSQEKIAELDLLDILQYYEGTVKVRPAGERIAYYEGNNSRFYIYKIYNKSNKEWFIGISGPQPVDKSKINFDSKVTDLFFETYSDENVEMIIQAIQSSQ
ncbi:MAG: hypothetical protein HY738_22500, partial [Bacteroidia bacterium]|nr:hypothetical protein [Bacteroidia bacterium]